MARPLSQTIRQRRKELALTQSDVANAALVGQAQISKIELGQKGTTLQNLDRILARLGLVVVPAESVAGAL